MALYVATLIGEDQWYILAANDKEAIEKAAKHVGFNRTRKVDGEQGWFIDRIEFDEDGIGSYPYVRVV